MQYGLPPSLDVKIADPLLDHFNLLDPDLSALQIRVTDLLTVLREGSLAATPEGMPPQPLVIAGEPPPQPKMIARSTDFNSLVVQAGEIVNASRARFAAAQLDLARWKRPCQHDVSF